MWNAWRLVLMVRNRSLAGILKLNITIFLYSLVSRLCIQQLICAQNRNQQVDNVTPNFFVIVLNTRAICTWTWSIDGGALPSCQHVMERYKRKSHGSRRGRQIKIETESGVSPFVFVLGGDHLTSRRSRWWIGKFAGENLSSSSRPGLRSPPAATMRS